VDGPEGLVVPSPEQCHELLVGAEPEQRHPQRHPRLGQCGRSRECCRCRSLKCGCFH
jgi:hypothetical protein